MGGVGGDPGRCAAKVGAFGLATTRGLRCRRDWGTQFTSKDYQVEIGFLWFEDSPSFLAEPETNGIAERSCRTLREQVLHRARFGNLAQARQGIAACVERHNLDWLIKRHGYQSPEEVPDSLTATQVETA